MEKFLILFALIPLALGSYEYCKDGKEDCPQGTRCCFRENKFECCDVNDPSLQEDNLEPGFSSFGSYRNESINYETQSAMGPCTISTCKGTCCDPYSCCKGAYCCPNKYCCAYGWKCCGNGTWCCKVRARCGAYYNTCIGAAGNFMPNIWTLVLILSTLLMSKILM